MQRRGKGGRWNSENGKKGSELSFLEVS